MPEQRDRGCLSPICPLGPPVDVVVARIGGKNTPERWRIVAGRSRIPSLREVFWLTLVIDDGSLADCVLEHNGDRRITAIVASIVGPKTVGSIIDQMFAVFASFKANDRYNELMRLVLGSKVEPFAKAILERSATEDPHQIYILSKLISRHGGSVDRKHLRLAPETQKRFTSAVQRWAEILVTSPEATRQQFAMIATAVERLGSQELVPVLLKLLSEDLKRRRHEQEEWLKARQQGRQIQTDAHMSWTLQYRHAFAAIGDQETVDAMKSHLRDPEFGFDAALVLKSVWREMEPKEDESGFLGPWPDFSVVPEAYMKRQSGDDAETHPFVDEIIAAIDDLIRAGTAKAEHLHALKLATVAFSMPYANKQETVNSLFQLPVPAACKRDLLTVLVLSGEAISSTIVLRGINHLLEEAKTNPWMLQENDGWRMEHWLRLLPFTEKPAAILDILGRAENYRPDPWNLSSLLSALRYAPSAEVETVLKELGIHDERFLDEYNWLVAVTSRNTLSAARFLLDMICNATFSKLQGMQDHTNLVRKMSSLMTSDNQLREDVYERFRSLDDGPARSVLEDAIVEAPDAEGILLLTRQGAVTNKSFQLTALPMALHNILVGKAPMDSSGFQQLFSQPAPELRKGLFDLMINGSAAETHLATECLITIDIIRDDYGHVDSEPRHPDIVTGVPWPNLDIFFSIQE